MKGIDHKPTTRAQTPHEIPFTGVCVSTSGQDSERGLMRKDSDILTVKEVAAELRCSKAHIFNVINGRVKNVPRLPCISLGRLKLIRRNTLEMWKLANEQRGDAMMPSSGSSAVDA